MSTETTETTETGDGVALIRYIDPAQVKLDMAVDMTNINEACVNQAGLYVFYASQAVKARAQSDRTKLQFEIMESALENEHRTRLKEENPKATEPQIRAAVVADPRWKAANRTMIAAQTIFRMAEKVEDGFHQRKDMLQIVARNLLREQEGSLRVTANQDARARFLEAAARTSAAAA